MCMWEQASSDDCARSFNAYATVRAIRQFMAGSTGLTLRWENQGIVDTVDPEMIAEVREYRTQLSLRHEQDVLSRDEFARRHADLPGCFCSSAITKGVVPKVSYRSQPGSRAVKPQRPRARLQRMLFSLLPRHRARPCDRIESRCVVP